jgi:hypothetical protein
MKKRLCASVLAAGLFAFAMIPGIAAADRPEKTKFSPVGDVFRCGESLLTIKSGKVVTRTHVHKLKPERFRVISVSHNKGITATDEEGVIYRVFGEIRDDFKTSDPDKGTDAVGVRREKFNFIGPDGGLFGTLDLRVRAKRNGTVVERDNGTCRLVV